MVSHNDFKAIKKGDKTVGTNWTKHKKIMNVSSRDYCDKMINFYHNGKFYHYSSMIPDDLASDMKKLTGDTVRGSTIYNISRIERNAKTGKLEY